jgi:hypothetical protein
MRTKLYHYSLLRAFASLRENFLPHAKTQRREGRLSNVLSKRAQACSSAGLSPTPTTSSPRTSPQPAIWSSALWFVMSERIGVTET